MLAAGIDDLVSTDDDLLLSGGGEDLAAAHDDGGSGGADFLQDRGGRRLRLHYDLLLLQLRRLRGTLQQGFHLPTLALLDDHFPCSENETFSTQAEELSGIWGGAGMDMQEFFL